jgi:hypothetical protein
VSIEALSITISKCNSQNCSDCYMWTKAKWQVDGIRVCTMHLLARIGAFMQ